MRKPSEHAKGLLNSISSFSHGIIAAGRSFAETGSSYKSTPLGPRTAQGLKKLGKLIPGGWRKMAFFSVGLMTASLLILVGILAATMSIDSRFRRAWVFYASDCTSASTVNTVLHLFINVVSTIILASSNFFMQVLNAPSQREVEAAHARGRWLDIGVPSWRNAFYLSRIKLLAWLILGLTSIPIHVLFNSAILPMGRRMGDFRLTIAGEGFLEGGNYAQPGASLFAKEQTVAYGQNKLNGIDQKIRHTFNSTDFGDISLMPTIEEIIENNTTIQTANISDSAKQASTWDRLSIAQCQSMYTTAGCTGLSSYRNVVAIANTTGWRRSEVWNLSATPEDLWEPIMPRDDLNTLWFHTQCNMQGFVSGINPLCKSNCNSALSTAMNVSLQTWYGNRSSSLEWDQSWDGSNNTELEVNRWNDKLAFKILYCMAEPRETTCAIAFSKPILLAVILSILVKLVTCVFVIKILGSQESLVTPGDAIAFFIAHQNKEAVASGFATRRMIQNRKRDGEPGPLKWWGERERGTAAIPQYTWYTTYTLLLLGLYGALVCLYLELDSGLKIEWLRKDVFEATTVFAGAGSGLISSVIVANLPQLYFSLCYLAYNSLLTQLAMSREWALFSVKHHPLRVTDPEGEQVATYRLQLPYLYSIPLIVVSTLAHWIISNGLFLFAAQGTYYQERPATYEGYGDDGYMRDMLYLPEDTVLAMGLAASPIMYLAIILAVMAFVPIPLSQMLLPGCMPVVGSNSLAIAAACHVSPLVKIPRSHGKRDSDVGLELERLVPASDEDFGVAEDLESSKKMTLYRLKWGEVRMPDDWYRQFGVDRKSGIVGHLSFGTVLDDPQPPTEGRVYA